MKRTYNVSKYEDVICGSGLGFNSYIIQVKYNDIEREGIEYELFDGGNVLDVKWQFCSNGFFEDYEGGTHYVSRSDTFRLHTDTAGLQTTFQDFVFNHISQNWNCSMRDLEIYYNLYLSYKGIITESELFEIVDKILG